jgi:hypothetical protein
MLVAILDDQHIGIVDAAARHANQDLARSWRWLRGSTQFERFGTTASRAHQRARRADVIVAHGPSSRLSSFL